MKSLLENKLYDWLTTACQLIVLGFLFFIYEYPSYHFRGFFDGALSLYLARSHTNFRSHLPGIFFGIQINFYSLLHQQSCFSATVPRWL